MPDFNIAARGFGDEDVSPPEYDVVGNYTGMRICVGYVGAEPKFLDAKELSSGNIKAACAWLGLDSESLSSANTAQAVVKWIDAGRPVPKDEDEISLSEFF